MRLSDVKKLSHSQCFVCAHAGESTTIYAKEYLGQSDDGLLWFSVYYKIINDPDAMFHGTRVKSRQFCLEHGIELYGEWVLTAQQEVDLSTQYNNWIDRTENEREDFYGG